MCAKFSDRIGVTKPRETLQVENMSIQLRSRIWNCIGETFYGTSGSSLANDTTRILCDSFFRERLETLPYSEWEYKNWLHNKIFNSGLPWHEVYNMLEFLLERSHGLAFVRTNELVYKLNSIFEDEMSGYRFMNCLIVPISSPEEMEALEEAIKASRDNELYGTQRHLEEAIKLLRKRPDPDYRNSIKESISAVESLTKHITGVSKGGLADALNALDEKVGFHGAFKQGLLALYGYTSDSKEGIRHVILEEPGLGFEEAKFMLVMCSSLIRFMISKASNAGLLV